MKLTTLIMITVILHLSAATVAQKVTLAAKNQPLSKVFDQISSQTGYDFVYTTSSLTDAKAVTINVTEEDLSNVLRRVLNNQRLGFEIDEKTIIIKQLPVAKPEVITQSLTLSHAIIVVRGTVTDENSLPLPGVTVKVKNGNAQVITNADGRYVITTADDAVLIFSFVGYLPQEHRINNRTSINITMKPNTQELGNVVVVGYGVVRKPELTSAVSVVKVADLQKAPVSTFEDALAGRAAGVQVTSAEGGPLANNSIVIRGGNSITQDNSPLYVIDGFPLENASGLTSTVNPADIENITILKDASSTAIYGSRGANGVILITTKRGKSGAPVVAFNGFYGFQKNIKTAELLGPYDYVQLQNEFVPGITSKLLYTPGDPTLGSSQIPGGRTLDFYLNQPAVDFQKQIFRTAPIQNYSLSVTGGNGGTRYAITGSYNNQDGTIIGSSFKRYQGRVVLSQEISRKLSLEINANYARTSGRGNSPSSFSGASSNSLLYSVWSYRPARSANSSIENAYDSAIDPDGQVGASFNPLLSVRNEFIENANNNILFNGSLSYKIFKDLTFKATGSINYTNALNQIFYNSQTARGQINGLLGPNATFNNVYSSSYFSSNLLTYDKKFGNGHALNAIALYEINRNNGRNNGYLASRIPNESLGLSGADEGQAYQLFSGSGANALRSYATRFRYNYKGKYFLSASFRADGSSRFAPGRQFAYFPAGDVAWNVAEEGFLKNRSTSVSTAKLRASYGTSGNNRVGDFGYFQTLNFSLNNYYAFANSYAIGTTPVIANDQLRWETTATLDIGMDLGFFKDRIQLTVDYYDKATRNLLLNSLLPPSLGYLNGLKNVGKVGNSGLEIDLNTVNIQKKNFSWNTSFNIAFNRNKVLQLSDNELSRVTSVAYDTNSANLFPYIAVVGQPVAQFYGYKWAGNFQYSDFDINTAGAYVLKPNVPANGNGRANIRPGDIKYEDLNGDLLTTSSDRVVIGDPNPDFIGGFSNNFRYLNFDLNVFFQFSYGNDVLNANRMAFETSSTNFVNQYATVKDRWTPENQSNTINRAGGFPIAAFSSRFIEDGSFLRLKTVNLGYTLPGKWLTKIKVKSARFYVSAQNLALWTKYSGIDPEVSTRNSALTPAFDFVAYPRARTISFGFNCSF